MTLVDKIRDLIAQGETERSLDELYSFVRENNADTIDNLVMLRSRMQKLNHDTQVGTLSGQDASIELAKINDGILKLLPQLTPEYLAEASKRKETRHSRDTDSVARPTSFAPTTASNSGSSSRKYMLIGGAITLLLLILIGTCAEEGTSTDNSALNTVQTEPIPETTTATTPPETKGGQMMPNQQTDHKASEPTFYLDHILSRYGQAVWKSSNGNATFELNGDGNFDEKDINGKTRFSFSVNELTEESVTLFDDSRKMYLLIDNTTVHFRMDGQSDWKLLSNGGWVAH